MGPTDGRTAVQDNTIRYIYVRSKADDMTSLGKKRKNNEKLKTKTE